MINRILNLDNANKDSIFIWGARQVGKQLWLEKFIPTLFIMICFRQKILSDYYASRRYYWRRVCCYRYKIRLRNTTTPHQRFESFSGRFSQLSHDCCFFWFTTPNYQWNRGLASKCFLKKLWDHEIVWYDWTLNLNPSTPSATKSLKFSSLPLLPTFLYQKLPLRPHRKSIGNPEWEWIGLRRRFTPIFLRNAFYFEYLSCSFLIFSKTSSTVVSNSGGMRNRRLFSFPLPLSIWLT